MTDVLVVGGGPAGASTAFRLARAGLDVVILDKAQFPRDKACAECLSPQASRILEEMGVLETLSRIARPLRGMEVRSPAGTVARGDYEAVTGHRAFRAHGLGIRRDALDAALLGSAVAAGARLRQGVRVTGVLRDQSGRVSGVTTLDVDGPHEERARCVVGADGLRSVVSRRLGLDRALGWPTRIALVSHYRDVRDVGEYVEMHVERDGFVGIAGVAEGVTTVAAVFPSGRAREFRRDRGAFLDAWLATRPQLRSRFLGATRLHEPRAVGPFASHARRAWVPGAVLVGDAADFFDPFTGEGIYAALRGGELAGDAIGRALLDDSSEPFRAYDVARRREFGGKWWVERLVAVGVASPVIVNRAVRSMAARKPLADLLAGVTGDFVPAGEVLRLSYLSKLFLAPIAGRQIP